MRHREIDVRVAADRAADARARTEAAYAGLVVRESAEEVLATDLDAVYVATPPATHAAIVLPAFERGLAAFCEKPLAIDLAEGEQLAAAAEGRVNAVNFALSDRASVLEAERAMGAGELGEVRSVEIRLMFPQWPRAFQADATWLARSAQGGFVREVFSHYAYLTDRMLGELTAEWTSVERPADSGLAETAATAVFRSPDGVPVRVWSASGIAAPETYEWTIHGSRRSFRITDWGDLASSDGGPWQPVEVAGERGSEQTRLAAFAGAVRGEPARNLADFAAALRVQRVVEGWLADG
jgi:predicted dehydrogenase